MYRPLLPSDLGYPVKCNFLWAGRSPGRAAPLETPTHIMFIFRVPHISIIPRSMPVFPHRHAFRGSQGALSALPSTVQARVRRSINTRYEDVKESLRARSTLYFEYLFASPAQLSAFITAAPAAMPGWQAVPANCWMG